MKHMMKNHLRLMPCALSTPLNLMGILTKIMKDRGQHYVVTWTRDMSGSTKAMSTHCGLILLDKQLDHLVPLLITSPGLLKAEKTKDPEVNIENNG